MGTSPDQIRAEIEATRDELTHDLDRLAERTSPRRAAHRRTERLRGAMAGARDRVKGHGGDGHAGTSGQAQERAQQAAQSMRESTGHAKEKLSATAGQAGDTMRSAPHQASSRTQDYPLAAGVIAFGTGMLASSMIKSSQAEQKAAHQFTDRVSGMAGPVKEAARDSVQHLKEDSTRSAQQAAERVKEAATDAARSQQGQQRSG